MSATPSRLLGLGIVCAALVAAGAAHAQQSTAAPGKSAQRVAGIVVGSLGIAALGVAGGLAVAASKKDDESKQYCLPEDPNKCFPKGVALRNESITYSDTATIVAISGGVVLVTGATLFLLAGTPKPTNKASNVWFVLPYASLSGAGLTLGGVF